MTIARIVLAIFSVFTCVSAVRTPLQNLQVTLRGKKYDVSDVLTVDDLKEKVKIASGNNKEHHVLFDGKRLSPASQLAEAGVEDGSHLNMVPALANKKKSGSGSESGKSSVVPDGVRTTTTTESTADTADAMKDYLKKSGVDSEKLDELMKQMGAGGAGGAAGAGGKMPDMNESLEQMASMMNNPMFQEYMNNPEMLEQSRQMILNNPMLKNMMAGMPGMADILEDPEAWREAMQAAASLYKNMDSEQLKSMMNGMGGMGGPPGMGGLFDGKTDNSAATAALDELDED